jgi:hypothetical protein
MKQKKITERYQHLRVLIMRAKEDADRWGEGQKPKLLQGIKEKSSQDFFIYDKAYVKFVKQRKQSMHDNQIDEAKQKEADAKNKASHTTVEAQLSRIADALERIAYMLEETITDSKEELN